MPLLLSFEDSATDEPTDYEVSNAETASDAIMLRES